MNSVRLWVSLASIVWFVSGISLGLLGSEIWRKDPPELGAIEHYTERMVEEFEIEPERATLFRLLMKGYQEEKDRIKAQHMAAQRTAMEPELEKLGARYTQLIRDKVLPESKRAKFDALCLGTP